MAQVESYEVIGVSENKNHLPMGKAQWNSGTGEIHYFSEGSKEGILLGQTFHGNLAIDQMHDYVRKLGGILQTNRRAA